LSSQGDDGIYSSSQGPRRQIREPRTGLDACVVRLGEGERISRVLEGILDEVDIASIHIYTLSPENPAGLHYHDFDEYWVFMEGATTVTLRSGGETKQYQLGPGDLVATPKGVEHGHSPQTLTKDD
jgi:mannose-6-phosphate isomerase-like protein (cupin superfamily)